jgi:hypothetical protein
MWLRVPLLMDNQSAIVLIKNPAAGTQNRSKHIDVAYNFARHRVVAGDISVSFVKTQDMAADILTKQLPGPAFRMHRENMGGHELNTSAVHRYMHIYLVNIEHACLPSMI